MKRLCLCLLLAVPVWLVWRGASWHPGDPASGTGDPAGPAVLPVEGLRESGEATAPRAQVSSPPAAVGGEARDASAVLRSLRQDVRWEKMPGEPEFAAFKVWADARSSDEAEGIRLAAARQRALMDLVERDPRRALELAVPVGVRRHLPPSVLPFIEEAVDGRGTFMVAAAAALPGKENSTPAVTRTVTLNGRTFDAWTYGRREGAMSRANLPIHGIAVGGRLALSEWPARVLEPVEAAELRDRLPETPVCAVSGAALGPDGDEVVLDFSLEQAQWFCQAGHAMQELLAASEHEAALPPGVAAAGGGGGAELPNPPNTIAGTKRLLVIRVDFPDKPGTVVSDATLTDLVSTLGTHWADMSYGGTSWARVGEGSSITPTVRLPQGHAAYTGLGVMLSAARAAAEDAGYDYRRYDYEVVVTGDKPDVSFGGIAYVGARGAWLANAQWNVGVCSHELGHNFGLNHSGFWQTSDGTPAGPGSNVEYGNPFDHMGGASSNPAAHFGARQKYVLGWLPPSSVSVLTNEGSATVRLAAMDRASATGCRALTVDRAGTAQDLWLEYRTLYTANPWMQDGLIVNFGDAGPGNGRPSLLDFAPATATRDDAPLPMGRTFSDPTRGIYITPVGRGTGPDGVPWVDVTVNRGAFAGNRRPEVLLQYAPLNPAAGVLTSFTAVASDADGDALSYYWEWGDGKFTAGGGAAAQHVWEFPGIKTVRCTVSDLKGGSSTASALVQVGPGNVFFVSGSVRTAGGAPFPGVTVTAGDRSDVTDAEGFYAVTGLTAGSYTVTASKTNYLFQPSGFSNPVTVGPGRTGADFVAPAGAPVFGPLKPLRLNAGDASGPLPVPLTDNDTPPQFLTLSAVSSAPQLIPESSVVFSGTDPLTVAVAAAAGGSGVVQLTLTATDPEGHHSSVVWPVTISAAPVLTAAVRSTPANVPLEVDLRSLVSDDFTAAGAVAFRVDRARNGTVELLPDGHTARFMPAANYDGPASFTVTAVDQGTALRPLLLYDFEPGSGGGAASGTIADASNYDRPGLLETTGNGEYAFSPDVPPALAPHSTASLNLTENGSGGAARIQRAFSPNELNWNDSDWTVCMWVKRHSTAGEDTVFHLGAGDGQGPDEELELFFTAGAAELKLQKHNAAGLQAEIARKPVPPGEWHHVAVTFDRTAPASGVLTLLVDGFFAGSSVINGMALDPAPGLIIGGHADMNSAVTRWLDGRLDDILVAGAVLNREEIHRLAKMDAAHAGGQSRSAAVSVSVAGVNSAPSVVPPPDTGLNAGQPSLPLPFTVSDAGTELRSLIVTGSSSNPVLIPQSGVSISQAPAGWTSADMGDPAVAGSTLEDHGTLIITGSGAGILTGGDSLRFVSQEVSGSGELVCRVRSVDFVTLGARAGLMLRAGSGTDAPFAMVSVSAGDGVQYQSRLTAGGVVESVAPVNFVAAPLWLRLVRGTGVTAWWAPDADGVPGTWQLVGGDVAVPFPAAVRGGITVCSGAAALPVTAVVDRAGGLLRNGGERTVTLTPSSGQTGTATITLTVSDGAATGSASFLVAVGVNTPPDISPLSAITIPAGQVPAPVTLQLHDLHTAAGSLTLSAASSNTLLLPLNRIQISGTGAQRTLQLRPVPGETGTAVITLTVGDGTATTVASFTLTVTPGDPALLVSVGTNWRYYDGTAALPAAWNTVPYNDSAWLQGPAQLGFGDGDEGTLVSANAARRTTYFRRRFQLSDAALFEWLQVNILRDDGAVVYLNGVELLRTNMPEGLPVTSASDALTAVNGAAENRFFPFTFRRPPFVTGTNVLAVEVHQKTGSTDDLSFDLEARGLHPSPVEAIPAGAVWSYLDDGADPGAGWTNINFVETGWKSGPAQLGYGDGDEATIINGGPENARHITAWFRRRFDLTDTADIAGMGLRVRRDDGIQVWLNDQPLFRDNLPAGAGADTLALEPAGTADESAWHTVWLPPDLLLPGPNQLAAEVHQSSPDSNDLTFDLQLLLYSRDALPALQAVTSPDGGSVTLTWPLWGSAWQLQSSADLQSWATESAPPVSGANGLSLTIPRAALRRYYRLALP